MISILNTIGLMDGFKGCVCPVDPTNQTELDALQPTIGNDKVWEDGKKISGLTDFPSDPYNPV